jgi:hypothetical protein
MKGDVSRYKNGIGLEIKQFVAFYAKRVSKKNRYTTTGVQVISLTGESGSKTKRTKYPQMCING